MKNQTDHNTEKNGVRSDSGWTLLEATISVVLISLIFLGFTVSTLSFREWMDRSWAIRVVDQYANDVLSNIDSLMRVGIEITGGPTNGISYFTIKVISSDVYETSTVDTVFYNFSAEMVFRRPGGKISMILA